MQDSPPVGAGATGQGKSVGLNAIITSLLYKKHPAELKFVMVDPKQVEFSIYSKIERHYLAKLPNADKPIVTEPGDAVANFELFGDRDWKIVINYWWRLRRVI